MKHANKNNLKKYQEHLKQEAKKFKLTADDLTNLTDLELMMPFWFVEKVLKPNKLKKWFLEFFAKIEKITLPELK